MVGNNTPTFFIRDSMKFPDFIHTQKRNPETNLKDPDMFWDFLSLTPESIHQVTILFSNRGTPKTFRNMNGYSSHTYMWYNAAGEHFWVKLHFKTEQGIKSFTGEEANQMRGIDPDVTTRDLHEAIKRGEYPSWRLEVQIMTPKQAENYRYDPFDITKVWPHADFPPIVVGKMVLNRNPEIISQRSNRPPSRREISCRASLHRLTRCSRVGFSVTTILTFIASVRIIICFRSMPRKRR